MAKINEGKKSVAASTSTTSAKTKTTTKTSQTKKTVKPKTKTKTKQTKKTVKPKTKTKATSCKKKEMPKGIKLDGQPYASKTVAPEDVELTTKTDWMEAVNPEDINSCFPELKKASDSPLFSSFLEVAENIVIEKGQQLLDKTNSHTIRPFQFIYRKIESIYMGSNPEQEYSIVCTMFGTPQSSRSGKIVETQRKVTVSVMENDLSPAQYNDLIRSYLFKIRTDKIPDDEFLGAIAQSFTNNIRRDYYGIRYFFEKEGHTLPALDAPKITDTLKEAVKRGCLAVGHYHYGGDWDRLFSYVENTFIVPSYQNAHKSYNKKAQVKESTTMGEHLMRKLEETGFAPTELLAIFKLVAQSSEDTQNPYFFVNWTRDKFEELLNKEQRQYHYERLIEEICKLFGLSDLNNYPDIISDIKKFEYVYHIDCNMMIEVLRYAHTLEKNPLPPIPNIKIIPLYYSQTLQYLKRIQQIQTNSSSKAEAPIQQIQVNASAQEQFEKEYERRHINPELLQSISDLEVSFDETVEAK